MVSMGTTAAMTGTSKTPDATLSGRQRVAVASLVAVAVAVMAMAVPRMVAGAFFALAPGVRENATLPRADEAAETLDWLARSQSWHPSAEAGLYADLSMQAAGRDGEQAVLTALLAQSPLRPEQWLRLGQTFAAAGVMDRALSAWRMSVYAARMHPPTMEERLDLGLGLKDGMTGPDLHLLDEQVRLSFIVRPAQVQRLMAQPRNARHREYYRSIINGLSETDIDQMIRIFALH